MAAARPASSAPDMPVAMPLPLCCIGVPGRLYADVFQSDEELIVELTAIWVLF
jgi:hypothetical protein